MRTAKKLLQMTEGAEEPGSFMLLLPYTAGTAPAKLLQKIALNNAIPRVSRRRRVGFRPRYLRSAPAPTGPSRTIPTKGKTMEASQSPLVKWKNPTRELYRG